MAQRRREGGLCLHGEGTLNGVSGYVNRKERLKAALPKIIEALPEFEPLVFDGLSYSFPDFNIIWHGLGALAKFRGHKKEESKIRFKTFFAQHCSGLHERLKECIIIFIETQPFDNLGVILAWLPGTDPESNPGGTYIKYSRNCLHGGEIWLCLGRLVVGDS